jgi:hypothetical protein
MDEGQYPQTSVEMEDSVKQPGDTGTGRMARPEPDDMDESMDESEELGDEELNGEDDSPFDDEEELEEDADGSPTR